MPKNRPKPRGGRRTGAGAPRGNLNALKHGARSRQFAQLGALLASSPNVREALFKLGEKHLHKQQKAEEVAAQILAGLFQYARDIAVGIDSPGPFREFAELNAARNALRDVQSNAAGSRRCRANLPDATLKKICVRTINRRTQTPPNDQS